jgi:tRNA pseudouridine32 synthase / 23S rRNA pseudouridine746 synthase
MRDIVPANLFYNPPQDPLKILYKDDDVLVLSKPSGLLSVQGKNPGLEDCLQSRALKEFPYARLVHRLDLDTSGVFLMALKKTAQAILIFNLKNVKPKNDISRVYGGM